MRKRNEVPTLKKQKQTDRVYLFLWAAVLCIYGIMILYTNFTNNPENFYTDMYTDMLYAQKAWEQKTIFPTGWVFGNQLYVVATPVLAAGLIGLTGDVSTAMALASSLMALGVLLSFNWMLKPVLPKRHHRLSALVAFLSVVLLCGDASYLATGWQLLFTMCSYYACYAITLFLAFGCYLRKDRNWSLGGFIMLSLACLMSLGTGIQSLRQTLIMVCPLVAVECIRGLECLIRKEKFTLRPLVIAGSISLSNLMGVFLCSRLQVVQHSTTGTISRLGLQSILAQVKSSFLKIFAIFGKSSVPVMVLTLLFIAGLLIWAIRKRSVTQEPAILCPVLLIVSVGGVFLIDLCTAMLVRDIYYFVLYILVALVPVYACAHLGRLGRIGGVALLVLCVGFNCAVRLPAQLDIPRENPKIQEMAAFLQDRGITTVYSTWNFGEEVAIASDFAIEAGFWNEDTAPFEGVAYLCDQAVYEADPSHCAYLFRGKGAAKLGIEAARQQGTELVLLEHFPELNVYIYTADVNLMS